MKRQIALANGTAPSAEGSRSPPCRPSSTSSGEQTSKLLLFSVLLVLVGCCGCKTVTSLVGAALPYAGVKLAFACIPEHTRVDTPSGPQPIERLEPGDWVIGFTGKPVRILQKHSYLEDPETTFLCITFVNGAEVDLCGIHRLDGIPAREIQMGQTISGREVASVTSRRGEIYSYDLLTEDAGYRVQGVPVNSMIEEMHTAAATGKLPDLVTRDAP